MDSMRRNRPTWHPWVACMGGVIAACAAMSADARAYYWKSHWPIGDDEDSRFCQVLEKRLNHLPEPCDVDAIESYSEFSDPPWKDIDPQEHIELLAQMAQLRQLSQLSKPIDPVFYRRAADFIRTEGEMKLWRTRSFGRFDGEGPETQDQERTVILLISKTLEGQARGQGCPGKTSWGWYPSTYLVLPDLSGLDPNVSTAVQSSLSTRRPVIYKGKPLLIRYNGVRHLEPDYGLCDFDQIKIHHKARPRTTPDRKPKEPTP